jgi:selenide, water dikinase
VLTKPLGTGIIATAVKAGAAPAAAAEASAASMRTLNREAAAAALRHGVTGATDVTGFGLAGHAVALAREGQLTLEIRASALPLLPEALELSLQHQAGGLKANRRAFEPQIEYQGALDERRTALVFDPQTSGGLLLLVPEERAQALLAELPGACAIGRSRERGERALVLSAA